MCGGQLTRAPRWEEKTNEGIARILFLSLQSRTGGWRCAFFFTRSALAPFAAMLRSSTFLAVFVFSLRSAVVAGEECGSGACSLVCCSGFYSFDDSCNEPFGTCASGIERMATCGASTYNPSGCADEGAGNPCCKLKVWAVALAVIFSLACWAGICYGAYRCCCAPPPAPAAGPVVVLPAASQVPPHTVPGPPMGAPSSGKAYYAPGTAAQWAPPAGTSPPPGSASVVV